MANPIYVSQFPNHKKYGLFHIAVLRERHIWCESKNRDGEIACLTKLSIFSSKRRFLKPINCIKKLTCEK